LIKLKLPPGIPDEEIFIFTAGLRSFCMLFGMTIRQPMIFKRGRELIRSSSSSFMESFILSLPVLSRVFSAGQQNVSFPESFRTSK